MGNQITIPHSVLLLFNALRLIPGKVDDCELSYFMKLLHEEHVTAENMHVIALRSGLMVSDSPFALLPQQHEFVDSFWLEVNGPLPLDKCWTLNGFQVIQQEQRSDPLMETDLTVEDTQSFVTFVPARSQSRPGVQIFVDSSISVDDLGYAWNCVFEFFPCHDTSFQMELALDDPVLPRTDKLVFAWRLGTL